MLEVVAHNRLPSHVGRSLARLSTHGGLATRDYVGRDRYRSRGERQSALQCEAPIQPDTRGSHATQFQRQGQTVS